MLELDKIDIQLLAALQHDGHATNPQLGERVHLSASQVSRRIQRLQEFGCNEKRYDPYEQGAEPVFQEQTILWF